MHRGMIDYLVGNEMSVFKSSSWMKKNKYVEVKVGMFKYECEDELTEENYVIMHYELLKWGFNWGRYTYNKNGFTN